jgi:hypothetical protein
METVKEHHVAVAAALAAAGLFAFNYLQYLPPFLHPGSGWYTWWDQGWYLKSALAFAQGDYSPGSHWYLPGYSLLGAVSSIIAPIDPFLFPNILCLLISLYFFLEIAKALGVNHTFAALAFLGATLVSPLMAVVWVEPWSSTAATPLTLGCVWAAIRFAGSPTPKTSFACAFLSGLLFSVRPGDAAVLLGAETLLMAAALLRAPQAASAIRIMFVAGTAGLSLAVLPLVALHVSIYGWHLSPYMQLGTDIGFEPRLLFVRWVSIFIDPRPLLSQGSGLSSAFIWVLPGLAGMAYALLAHGKKRIEHLMLIVPSVLMTAGYLCFRDLNQPNIWTYHNYHYFKTTMLVLALYGLLVVQFSIQAFDKKSLATSLAMVLALSWWRIELEPSGNDEAWNTKDARMSGMFNLGAGLARLDNVYFLAVDGARPDSSVGLRSDRVSAAAEGSVMAASIYVSPVSIEIGGRELAPVLDYKLMHRGRGFLVVPLRSLPNGAAILSVGEPLSKENVWVRSFTQRAIFAAPCWVPWSSCDLSEFAPNKRFKN